MYGVVRGRYYYKIRGMQGEGKVIGRLGEGEARARGSEVRGSWAEGNVR